MHSDPLLDLYLDDDGEIAVGYNGDLRVSRDADVFAQEMTFRLKTTRGDWVLEPDCGADLELLIGQPNSPETAAEMEAQISYALTHDGFLAGELKDVQVVPITRQQLAGLITVEMDEQLFTKSVTLDLKEGLL